MYISKEKLLALMYDFYNAHTLIGQNKDIDYYINQIKNYSSKKILIVGAGTGRVAIPLSNYATITALDFDKERLEILKTKNENVNTICCDFLDFNLSDDFDLIIVPYSTIQFGGDKYITNSMLYKLNQIMSNNTICIFDTSASFKNKEEKTRELLFSGHCDEIDDNIDVYYSSKKYREYIEFFIEYKLAKRGMSVIENEKYLYYDEKLYSNLLSNNNLSIIKMDEGYGNNEFSHKHLYHCKVLKP